MKTKMKQELAAKSVGELQKQAEEIEKELVQLRIRVRMREEKNTRAYKNKRQELAVIKSLISAKASGKKTVVKS